MKSLKTSKQTLKISPKKDLVRFDYHDREACLMEFLIKRGGILHMLRNYLGDDAFLLDLMIILKPMNTVPGEAHQLRLSLEKVSLKISTGSLINGILGSGYPKLEVSSTYDDEKTSYGFCSSNSRPKI